MLLAIDVGNTNTVFGIYNCDELVGSFRISTNIQLTSDEIGMQIVNFYTFMKIDINDTKGAIISSVVPPIMHSLVNALKKYICVTPYIVGETIDTGMLNKYDNPAEVGADRLVNAVYAKEKYGTPLIIIDIGTATTFDAISKDGEYLGGAIFPGIKVSMDALFLKAAKLPRVDIVKPQNVIGTNTVTSIQSGAMNGYIGAINGIIDGMLLEVGSDAKIVATGGMARMFATDIDRIFDVDINMTLEGLKIIYNNIK